MFGSRCSRSRSWSSLCPACLRRVCPPASSSRVKSWRGTDWNRWADDGALGPLAVSCGGRWHAIAARIIVRTTGQAWNRRTPGMDVVDHDLRRDRFLAWPPILPVGAARPVACMLATCVRRYCSSMERQSFLEYLDNFQRLGGECAYVHRRGYRTERWSYRRISETASQFARELETRTIGKGDPVVIWGQNCAEWVVAFFGCALRGAVIVPMDNVATADFALRVYQQVGAKLLSCSREHSTQASGLPTIILEDLSHHAARHSAAPYPAAQLSGQALWRFVLLPAIPRN